MDRLYVAATRLDDGRPRVYYGALDTQGMEDVAASNTLIDLIHMAHWSEDSLSALKDLVSLAETGGYISPDPQLPDFGINDVNLWLVVPMTKPALICVTNENTEFTHEAQRQQYFTFGQFWDALACYARLAEAALERGQEGLI